MSEFAVISLALDPLCVGEYTPYEIYLLSKRRTAEADAEADKLIALAWHTEAFARTKRLPKLGKILRDIHKKNISDSRGDMVLRAMAKEKGVNLK